MCSASATTTSVQMARNLDGGHCWACPGQPGDRLLHHRSQPPAAAWRRSCGTQGVAYLDAPVTGGTEGATAGTLSVLVGGAPEHLERARPLLEVIGGTITTSGRWAAARKPRR